MFAEMHFLFPVIDSRPRYSRPTLMDTICCNMHYRRLQGTSCIADLEKNVLAQIRPGVTLVSCETLKRQSCQSRVPTGLLAMSDVSL